MGIVWETKWLKIALDKQADINYHFYSVLLPKIIWMYTLNLFIISRSRNKKWFFTVTKWLFHLVMFISLCEKENNAIWTTLILILGLSWLLHFVFSWCCTTEYCKTVHKILTLFFTWKALWRFKSEAEETSAKLETYFLPLCTVSTAKTPLFILWSQYLKTSR